MTEDLFQKLIADTHYQKTRCEQAAKKYLPDASVRILLIGESPPISGNYFYAPIDFRGSGNSLPGIVMRGLLDTRWSKDSYEDSLLRLKERAFYLMDLCGLPINMFTHPMRVEFIRQELAAFIQRFKSLDINYDAHIILVLPSATIKELQVKRNQDIMEQLSICGISKEAIVKWSALEETLILICDEN